MTTRRRSNFNSERDIALLDLTTLSALRADLARAAQAQAAGSRAKALDQIR